MATKFWGLVAENGRRYHQKAERGFFITMATLEPVGIGTQNSRYDEKPVHVMVDYDSTSYILCTLWFKEHIIQAPLNIPFGKGEVLEVYIQGGSPKTKVHLTGFYSDSVPASPSNERQSILVSSDSKPKDKAKKRVSIQDEVNIKRFENDEEEDDGEEDDTLDYDEDDSDEDEARLLSLMNGKLGSMEDGDDDDDDDDDDEEGDFELDDDEEDSDDVKEEPSPKEKKNGDVVKEKAKQKSSDGKKRVTGDSDEDNETSDDDSNEVIEELVKSPPKNKKLEALKTPESNKKNKKLKEMSTPENQSIQVKSHSSAGHTPMKFVSKGGLMIHELKVGSGPPAKQGKMVTVYYTGRLKANNRQFDATTSGPGFRFRLGKGEVIKGWDIGLEGMKVGGKRRIIVPSHMAYGKKGAPPDIPPSSTLVFEIDLKNVS